VVDEGATVTGFNTLRFVGPYGQAASPARYAVERSDWKLAMTLEPHPSSFPFTVALTYFARALGGARGGNLASSEKDILELAKLRDSLKAVGEMYWANEVEVSRLGAEAWIALARGNKDEALAMMRSAAEIEDKNEKHIVTPGRILPARELLGEMLLELNRPVDALAEFEASQVREPGRFRGYYGAAVAAEKSGNMTKATMYYSRLVELADKDSKHPELDNARRFLAKVR
jgi:tetratricopeptide (TPR) repeat protein